MLAVLPKEIVERFAEQGLQRTALFKRQHVQRLAEGHARRQKGVGADGKFLTERKG